MCEKWLLKYRELCCYYKNISLDSVMSDVIDKFNKEMDSECDDIKPLLIDDFNKGLEFLISNDIINEKYKSILVKKIG